MRLVEAGNDNYKRSDFAGVIYHVDSIHNFLGLDRNLYWHVIGSLKQLPINISEWHYCHDDFLIYTVSPFFAYYISKDDGSHKTKWHLHNGRYPPPRAISSVSAQSMKKSSTTQPCTTTNRFANRVHIPFAAVRTASS